MYSGPWRALVYLTRWTKVTIRTGTIVHMRSDLFINFVVFHGHVRNFPGKRTKFINSSMYANSLWIKGKICTCCTYLPDTLNYCASVLSFKYKPACTYLPDTLNQGRSQDLCQGGGGKPLSVIIGEKKTWAFNKPPQVGILSKYQHPAADIHDTTLYYSNRREIFQHITSY